MGDEVDEEEIR